jgi:hypothetical protein
MLKHAFSEQIKKGQMRVCAFRLNDMQITQNGLCYGTYVLNKIIPC